MDPRTPKAADTGSGEPKPKPDMAALMLELARIRREVEGAEPPRPGRKVVWLSLAMVLGAVLLSVFLGPCRPPAGG
jgi:hypothetical protein